MSSHVDTKVEQKLNELLAERQVSEKQRNLYLHSIKEYFTLVDGVPVGELVLIEESSKPDDKKAISFEPDLDLVFSNESLDAIGKMLERGQSVACEATDFSNLPKLNRPLLTLSQLLGNVEALLKFLKASENQTGLETKEEAADTPNCRNYFLFRLAHLYSNASGLVSKTFNDPVLRKGLLQVKIEVLENLVQGMKVQKPDPRAIMSSCLESIERRIHQTNLAEAIKLDRLFYSSAKHDNSNPALPASHYAGGVTDWLDLIWHVCSELKLGRYIQLHEQLLDASVSVGLEGFVEKADRTEYFKMSSPQQLAISDALDSFHSPSPRDETTHQELWKFFVEEVKRHLTVELESPKNTFAISNLYFDCSNKITFSSDYRIVTFDGRQFPLEGDQPKVMRVLDKKRWPRSGREIVNEALGDVGKSLEDVFRDHTKSGRREVEAFHVLIEDNGKKTKGKRYALRGSTAQ